jgi:beta-lactamase regulating signal transducer with metallopeptidase domain
MSTVMRCYPGDRGIDFLLVVTLAVALASSAAWLISRRLAGKGALRHLVLFSALICCLASPAAASFCAATGLTLFSIPILRGDRSGMASGVTQIETDPAWLPPRESSNPPPVAAALPLPRTNTTIDQNEESAIAPAANQSPESSMPFAPDGHSAGSQAGTQVSLREIATGAMFVWAAGAMLMLARLGRNCGRAVQLRRSAHPLQNEVRQSLFQESAAKLGMRQVPLLLVSSRTVIPLAIGFGRPAVILPQRLLGSVSDNELRDVLVHELAHLRRGDQRIVLLQELARALYWPILSVHGLNRELRRVREELCDNVVLAGRSAISYGETLLHVAELLVNARPTGATAGILGGQGDLERRIAGLVDPYRSTTTTIGRKTACVVIFMFIAWGAIASATRFAASASAASAPADDAARAAPPIDKPRTAEDPEDLKFAGHFNGRVNGPDGKPLSGARVFIVRANGANKEAGPVRAKTNAAGRFEFDAPDMTYLGLDGRPARREGLVIVTADGYAPDWVDTWGQEHKGIQEDWDPVKGAALALQLANDDVPIHGRLLDPDGRPLAGARVRLSGLMIPRGRDLGAHLERWSKASVMSSFLTNAPGYERELLRPGLIPGLTTETRTAADGRFTMSGLGRDRLAELRVSAPSVVDTTLTVMTRAAPDVGTLLDLHGKATQIIHGAGFTLRLERGGTIRGRVIDRDSREPIPGMWVGPLQNVLNEFSSNLYPWTTDEKGRFTITGLDPKALEAGGICRQIVAAAAPGLPYQTAWVEATGNAEVLIECRRGIPFRLKLVDEHGRPVEGEVTYVDVQPNANVVHDEVIWPVSRAARKADGSYHGYVLPGPGAVLVRTKREMNYRSARVDPKAFFAPGRTDWTPEEQITAFGTPDTLTTCSGRYIGTTYRGSTIDQRAYTAIVLVNAPPNSGALELSATVVRDRPRRVSLVDPDGKLVSGARMEETIQWPAYSIANGKAVVSVQTQSTALRHASFPLTGLHPLRVQHITFVQEDRRLIGLLRARGDSDSPYTVRMQPWGTVTGRIVDENGKPLAGAWIEIKGEGADSCERVIGKTDAGGRFRADRVIPGLSYGSVEIYQGTVPYVPSAATSAERLVLRPGEVCDSGDIRATPSVDVPRK